MSNVAEFIEIRKSIETLATQITQCIEQNAVQDSKQRLEKANQQLEELKAMVANDVQVIVVGRLSRQLAGLGAKTEKIAAKLPARKRPAKKKLEVPIKPHIDEAPQIVIFEH
ncbi:hypothetical protein [Syntrophorhabdus aromaticivorans]|jgi:hypothetical protein|uniref:Uncharacterized protein n=1 Tax=Syntrophorhabdus aromaticivorans TaxID=328301 RepID=A0A351U1G5_9BACT|nr:hypothetical protein [Syntrophorhabdus aromaticivorans]NLW34344.1 hypothetical protein [Syntrophorhabdus aromaticivorans]HBA53796.1 hypothetical protein [Syntrophorhabdus aromaticivorans]